MYDQTFAFMKFIHKALLLITANLLCFFSCESSLEEKIVSRYPSGIASKVELFADTDSGKVLVKEIRFFPNGEKDTEGEIKDGKKDGKWKQWYNNGKLWIEEQYSEGIKNGTFIVYYPNGEKNYAGEYKYGMPTGTWKFWNEKGEILKETSY